MTLLTIDCYVRPNRQVSIVDIPTYCDVNLLLLAPSSCVTFVMANRHGRVPLSKCFMMAVFVGPISRRDDVIILTSNGIAELGVFWRRFLRIP